MSATDSSVDSRVDSGVPIPAGTSGRKPLVTIGGRPVWSQAGPVAPRSVTSASEDVAVARVAMVERLRATAALRRRRTLWLCVSEINDRRPWLLPTLLLAIVGLGVLLIGIGAGRTKQGSLVPAS